MQRRKYLHSNNFYLSFSYQQASLPAKSEHTKSLKSKMAYSQNLRLRTTCSATTEYYKYLALNKQKFLGKKYQGEDLIKKFRM